MHPQAWLSAYGRSTFMSWDFYAALATASIVAVGAAFSGDLRDSAGTLAAATTGVSTALLSISLAAMSIITAFLTRTFVALVPNFRALFMPFQTIAVISALALLLSLTLLLVGSVASAFVASALLAAVAGFTVWSICGSLQLVGLVTYFATVRGSVMETMIEAEAQIERRQGADRAS